jgi:hypothetical protein
MASLRVWQLLEKHTVPVEMPRAGVDVENAGLLVVVDFWWSEH